MAAALLGTAKCCAKPRHANASGYLCGRLRTIDDPHRLIVLTQNVWGTRGAWDKRRAVLRRLVGDLKPDLVSFQEAIKTADYDQAADLLGPDYHVVHQSAPEPDGQSAVIASRWPIQSMREAQLHVTPRTQGFACTTVVAELPAPEPFGSLLLVNHLPNWQLDFALERELQAARAARFVEEVIGGRKVHVILAGDLTDGPDSASVRLWTGRQSVDGVSVCYRDAWESANPGQPGETFTPRNAIVADPDWPARRLDYVMVRCGDHGGPTLAIKSCRLLFEGPIDGVWASDHFGVVADLVMPSRPALPLPNLAESR